MPLIFTIEALAFAAALTLTFALRSPGGRIDWAERPLAFLTGHRSSPFVAAFCLTFALGAFLAAVRPPTAGVHDELSYLLAADTFASGRLTNPPHPHWRHFETMHVLQQPTYQSRYPPGQGLALALGRVLTGYYIVGAWISMAAAAAALYWALAAWMPRRWALLGALLPILRFGGLGVWDVQYYAHWTTSYWGGAVALLGAALAFGATPRLLRRPRARDGAVLGIGLAILAITRPYEGLVMAAPLGLLCLAGIWRSRRWSALGALAAILMTSGAGVAYYNQRVTGSALELPYKTYGRQYDAARNFRFQELRPLPDYHNAQMRAYHTGFMLENFEAQSQGVGLSWWETKLQVRFFLGLALAPICLLGLAWRGPWRWICALLLSFGFASHALTGVDPLQPHYFAPFAPALLLLTLQGLRLLRTIGRRGGWGLALVQGVIAVCGVSFLAAAGLRAFVYESAGSLENRRQAVLTRLEAQDGPDLVFVRYSPGHSVHSEWVYNGADIDASNVVWARELSEKENRELVQYFSGRRAWVVHADERPPRLEPYPGR